jgi:hypothetical protein
MQRPGTLAQLRPTPALAGCVVSSGWPGRGVAGGVAWPGRGVEGAPVAGTPVGRAVLAPLPLPPPPPTPTPTGLVLTRRTLLAGNALNCFPYNSSMHRALRNCPAIHSTRGQKVGCAQIDHSKLTRQRVIGCGKRTVTITHYVKRVHRFEFVAIALVSCRGLAIGSDQRRRPRRVADIVAAALSKRRIKCMFYQTAAQAYIQLIKTRVANNTTKKKEEDEKKKKLLTQSEDVAQFMLQYAITDLLHALPIKIHINHRWTGWRKLDHVDGTSASGAVRSENKNNLTKIGFGVGKQTSGKNAYTNNKKKGKK